MASFHAGAFTAGVSTIGRRVSALDFFTASAFVVRATIWAVTWRAMRPILILNTTLNEEGIAGKISHYPWNLFQSAVRQIRL
jgi:hypothetical protein